MQSKKEVSGTTAAVKHYDIHPAAELFPMMSDAELLELAADMKAHGQRVPMVIERKDPETGKPYSEPKFVDGRNRAKAHELNGTPMSEWKWEELPAGVNAFDFVLSANIHRRHLTVEQRSELAAKLLEASPSRSDRAIAKQVGLSPTKVGKVRAAKATESTVHNGQLKRVGADGKARKMPAKKTKATTPEQTFTSASTKTETGAAAAALETTTAGTVETVAVSEATAGAIETAMEATTAGIVEAATAPEKTFTVDLVEQISAEHARFLRDLVKRVPAADHGRLFHELRENIDGEEASAADHVAASSASMPSGSVH